MVIFAGLVSVVVVLVVVVVATVVVVAIVVELVDPVVLLVLLLPVVVDPVVEVLTVCKTESGPLPATALALIAPAASSARNVLPITNFRLIAAPFLTIFRGC
jgi:hypothetical protein